MDFRCHCCGCVFEAEPDSFILDTDESTLEVEYDPEDDLEEDSFDDVEFSIKIQQLTKDELKKLTVEQLDEIGMTPELREMILAAVPSQEICDGAVALCKGCREGIGL